MKSWRGISIVAGLIVGITALLVVLKWGWRWMGKVSGVARRASADPHSASAPHFSPPLTGQELVEYPIKTSIFKKPRARGRPPSQWYENCPQTNRNIRIYPTKELPGVELPEPSKGPAWNPSMDPPI